MVDQIQNRCFSAQVGDAMVWFQIIKLQKQYYVWCGTGTPHLSSMYAGMPMKTNSQPAIASIMHDRGHETGCTAAQRIVKRTGLPLLLSMNLPDDNPTLCAEVERRILLELTT